MRASLTHVPWAAYYLGGGHNRHHRFAGTRRDIDGDALMWLWEKPCGGAFRRFCWLSVAAAMVPITYNYSLLSYAMRDLKANRRELAFVFSDSCLTIAAHMLAWWTGAAYLLLSAFFSMGFLCHPLVTFWLLQHLCVDAVQPTVSYSGSKLWNFLCLNELLHVEHHDLSGISWRHLPKLHSAAPELYSRIHTETSLFRLISDWLFDTNWHFGWDFACRQKWQSRLLAAEAAQRAMGLSRAAVEPLKAYVTARRPNEQERIRNEELENTG